MLSFLCLLAAASAQAPAQESAAYVVSIVTEATGDDLSLRFILSGPPGSYSAVREGDEIVVRIAAEALPGLSLPADRAPIRSLLLGAEEGFSLRVALSEDRTHEMVREFSSLRLVLHPPTPEAASPSPAATPSLTPVPTAPRAVPSPAPERTPARSADPVPADTADLYRRLFPSPNEPSGVEVGRTEIGAPENWYSDFRWLGFQVRPWISVSHVDGKTTAVQDNTVTGDKYWVIQPNLGLGFSPRFGGPRAGQWSINYTPRFRRQLNLGLPHLAAHFFDIGLDQPVAAFGSLYGNYHFSTGVLETEEIDPGREYGIGQNRVVDTSLEQFRRDTFAVGFRFDFLADTKLDVNVGKTKVRYGNEDEAPVSGPRAFFDYNTQSLNASLRRDLGESRQLSLVFQIHDTPAQPERAQIEGRGYTYAASVDGEIAALTTGRILFGYRTQKSPNAGEGGQDYQGIAFGAQLVRELPGDTALGVDVNRQLYLSAYENNGFYVADTLRGDFNTRLPLALFLRASAGLQSNNYKTSPQVSETTGDLVLRQDRITYWTLGVTRSITEWAFLRFDYISERRDSNLNRFDINSRALTFQLGLGFFGKSSNQVASPW